MKIKNINIETDQFIIKFIFYDLKNNTNVQVYSLFILKHLKEINFIDFISNITINCQTYLFFSLKDLEYCFSIDHMKPYYTKKKIGLNQRRNISGNFKYIDNTLDIPIKFNVYLNDLCVLGTGSLLDLAESCGIEVYDKTSLDNYKTRMDEALIEKTNIFLTYAFYDTLLLL